MVRWKCNKLAPSCLHWCIITVKMGLDPRIHEQSSFHERTLSFPYECMGRLDFQGFFTYGLSLDSKIDKEEIENWQKNHRILGLRKPSQKFFKEGSLSSMIKGGFLHDYLYYFLICSRADFCWDYRKGTNAIKPNGFLFQCNKLQ